MRVQEGETLYPLMAAANPAVLYQELDKCHLEGKRATYEVTSK